MSKESVDVVITDIYKPGMNGWELTEIIKSKYDTDVITCTGYHQKGNREKARRIGAFAYLIKPIKLTDLLDSVEEVLKRRFPIMNQELIFNLWAIYDADTGLVYALSGKAYKFSGSDAEKLALLKKLSATDYLTAKRYPVPERFKVSYADGTKKNGVTFLNALRDPNAQLFEEIFRNLEAELPPFPDFSGSSYKEIKQKTPDDPLCVVTVLYEDGTGSIRPIITGEDRQWIAQQERLMRGI